MIERKYVEYELAKGKKDICIVCNCKNAETLNTFLCSDVRPFEEWIKSDFDKVLSGEIISKEISGNVCCAEINFKNTKIYNMLIEDDDEYYETCCEVDTKELRQLIDEWCDKVREFKMSITTKPPHRQALIIVLLPDINRTS